MKGARILAVDDDENFLQLLIRTLQKEGYEVRTAAGGEEALGWLERECFDLALVDLRMNPVDGLVLLGEIKNLYPHMQVIMMTAYPSRESRILSVQRGACRYLVKPIELAELKEAIRTALSHLEKGKPGVNLNPRGKQPSGRNG
jgi:DNA-binding NtrC family response regulator